MSRVVLIAFAAAMFMTASLAQAAAATNRLIIIAPRAYDQERLGSLKPNEDWYPPSIFFQGTKFMMFGDPSLRLPENRTD
jgi:hypothetical protein